MRLVTERVLSRSLARHPRRYAGERAVGLQNNHELDAPVFEPPGNQHGLPAPRVEPIVDPSFDQMFVGSMSPFREEAAQRGDFQCGSRSGLPWFVAVRVYRKGSRLAQRWQPT